MEYFIVIIAAASAGVGTGLVGLSAATVMVPLLVVLCPAFQGAHGAFMATAIALASDILGSAVSAGVYAKHKNLDLKRGSIMFACIVATCIGGSVAAFFTPTAVLGGFSLFLCIAIGIRFLIKPDSGQRAAITEGHKFSAKEIAVSLFFGMTIGFGTGFFGSGGGMMMLIVFTAFLKYDRKTAVGTSTFIMTFTALIASVSHIAMEPTILLERWDYLIVSIVTATAFSLVSAQFANKVNGKVTGLVTGAILFVLGIALVLIEYREQIGADNLIAFGKTFAVFLAVLVGCAAALSVIRFTTKIPDYIFRKLLHLVAVLSIFPLAFCSPSGWISVAVDACFIVLIIIALVAAERASFYQKLFVEKGKHEVLISFVSLFTMIGGFLAVFWGWLGQAYRYIAIASIMAWGPGDGMAVIIGIRFGRHKLSGRLIEGTKSVEGTAAMALTSFVCTFLSLLFLSEFVWYLSLAASAATAAVSALVELFTKRGWDTVTVPVAACGVLCLFAFL